MTIADRHAPLTQRRVRGIDNCPWLNKSIKVTMRQRDYFQIKAIKSNASEHWANYRHFRNRVTKEIRSAKASYNKRLIEESGGDHISFWKTIKKILPGEKKATSPNITVDGVVSSDKQCIANAFNKFFASAASKLMATLRKTCGNKQRDSDTPARQYPPFNFLEISEEFVYVSTT